MKVLITFGSYAPARYENPPAPLARAGAELMAINTATALAERGHMVALGTDGPEPVADPPLPCLDLAADLPWTPDLVHAFDLAKPTTVRYGRDLALRLGVPFVLTPSSARSVWPDVTFGDEACAAANRVLVLTSAETDDLGLPDRSLARQVGQGPSLIGSGDPAAFRRQVPGRGPVVLFLGRRSHLKGLDVLAQAAPRVWQAVPDAIFAVAGPPGDADGYMAALNDHRMFDLGTVDLRTKTDAIAGSTLLCLPSRADVFPLVFVESWTLGRPVVSGDFSGVTDVVRHDVDGLICAVHPEPVARALIALLTDPRRCARLGASGQERAKRELTWKTVAEAVESCYHELTSSRGRCQ